MVVIDEDEFIDLEAEIIEVDSNGKEIKHKFKKDKFYMKDMDVLKIPVDEEEVREMFRETIPNKFIEEDDTWNNQFIKFDFSALGPPESRPSIFSDSQFMSTGLVTAEVAEEKMKEAEKLAKQKRKDRLKLFDNCLKEYLNLECGSDYKIKYDR